MVRRSLLNCWWLLLKEVLESSGPNKGTLSSENFFGGIFLSNWLTLWLKLRVLKLFSCWQRPVVIITISFCFNLFVTSKNETANSPIHESKVLKMSKNQKVRFKMIHHCKGVLKDSLAFMQYLYSWISELGNS